ncbi:hypothetical protein F0237_21940 [Vibrio tubiashii]|uniref:Uncharacterized protein n=1 Tax=Vibrio tubiashii TaxID=29498 RepID=A0AAE5GUM9_9VIBR|nr:hypothetical protein [Vibrio tubiashii]NOI83324.1 hypothetical protein [Vibrio tubiashii]
MLRLYNPPRQPAPSIEFKNEGLGTVGTAAIFHFTDRVELVELSVKRTSLSDEKRTAKLCDLTFSFLKSSELIERRYMSVFFAKDFDHHYPMTLIKPKGADELQIISSVALVTRIESRLIFKQEVPDAVAVPDLITE